MTTDLTIPASYLFTDNEQAILADFLEIEITKCVNMHGDVLDAEKLETIKKMQKKLNLLSI